MMNSPNDDKQCTPSWKVNLTQKFNQFCKSKNVKHQRNQVISFQDQLEQQLKSIPIQREELSSNKKYRIFHHQQEEQKYPKFINNNNKTSDARIQPKKDQNQYIYQNFDNSKSLLREQSDQSKSPTLQRLNFDTSFKKQQSQQESFFIFTNKKVVALFKEYFSQRQSIELKEFVDMCCLQFLKKQSLTPQIKQILINQCRSIFCTTDQNLISLNAIQLITKKTHLQIIIFEKFLQSKYKKKKRDLQKQYEDILVEIMNQQQHLKQENDTLAKRKKQLQAKEKQSLKRQKHLKVQEKQLLEKQKLLKKTLQEKHIKLTNQLSHQFQNLTKQLQKKSSTMQRNARNKLQLLEKRSNDFRHEKHNQHIPQKDSDDQMSKKYQNQCLLLKSKLRKMEKQFQSYFSDKSKEIKNLQAESNSLLKANTLLENKLEKSKNKCKELNQIVAKQSIEVEEIQRELDEKVQRVQNLQNFALEFEHQQAKSNLRQISKPSKEQSRIDSRLQHKQNPKSTNKETSQAIKKHQNDNSHQMIQKVNTLLSLILKGFENQQKINKQSRQIIKIEQVLLTEAQSIISVCSDILWTAIEQDIKSIEHITQFILKLFMAKFSFLKFQSITKSSFQQNSIQELIQQIQKSFYQNNQSSIESKLKTSSYFLQSFQQESSLQATFNLNLVLTILGFDETYCQSKNRLQPIVTKLHQLASRDIENSQTLPKNNLQIIKKLQDEQTMTYLFWKYMSYSTSQQQSSTFIDILVELCNFYSSTAQISTIPLFKTIFALDNYKYFFNFLLINFTQQNLLNKSTRQMFEKISIVLQRFCYTFGQNISMDESDLKRLKKIVKELNKNKNFQASLFKANMENILDKISEDKQ